MTVTLATLRTHVRDRLNEASARAWTDAQLNTWINEGARDLARRTETLQSIFQVTTAGGTQTYTFAPSSPPTRMHRAEWNATGDATTYPLEYRDFGTMDEVWGTSQKITTGIPQYWTMWGTPGATLNITLYPTPPSAGVLAVFYYRVPVVAASDNATVEVPEGWDDLICDYAEFHALRRDRDQRWQEAMQLYEQRLEEFQRIAGGRWSDQAGQFVHAGAVPFGMPWLYDA